VNSNAQPEHEICPHDGHMLDRTGKCWYCGGIYPAGKPALTVVESEPQVEVESVEAIDATISVQKDDGTFTEPVPFDSFRKAVNRLTERVDPETGEVQEPAGQMVLGNDPAFVRPTRRRDVPTVKVTFAGTVELEQEEFEALTDGKELAPGRVVYIRASAYMPGPHTAWVKRTEKDEDTGERESWWEHQGRLALKVTEIGGLDVTDREWSDD